MVGGARTARRPGSMADLGISHVGLRVDDLERSREFYRNILGLESRANEEGVVRIPSGGDRIVLHRKHQQMTGSHFGFRLESSSKVDEWRAWLKGRKLSIYEYVNEENYRGFKIRDPDGYLIEIFFDERETAK